MYTQFAFLVGGRGIAYAFVKPTTKHNILFFVVYKYNNNIYGIQHILDKHCLCSGHK